MNASARHRLLAVALLATLAAAWLAPEPPEDPATAATLPPLPTLLEWPSAPQVPALAQAADGEVTAAAGPDARAGRKAAAKPSTDDAASPPAPTMPKPPFRLFGRIERDGETLAFLSHAGRTLTATAGDNLPGDWQVESVGSDGVVLTYLPLGQTTRLPLKANTP